MYCSYQSCYWFLPFSDFLPTGNYILIKIESKKRVVNAIIIIYEMLVFKRANLYTLYTVKRKIARYLTALNSWCSKLKFWYQEAIKNHNTKELMWKANIQLFGSNPNLADSWQVICEIDTETWISFFCY